MSKILAILGLLAALAPSAWAGDDKEAEEALKKFSKGMANPSPAARAAAGADLARTPFEKGALALGNLMGGETDSVKIAAAEGKTVTCGLDGPSGGRICPPDHKRCGHVPATGHVDVIG